MYSGHGVERLEEHLSPHPPGGRGGAHFLGQSWRRRSARPSGEPGRAVRWPTPVTRRNSPNRFVQRGWRRGPSRKLPAACRPVAWARSTSIRRNCAAARALAGRLLGLVRGLILDRYCASPNAWGFRLHLDSIPQGLGQQDFFSGITVQPGGDARRELPGAGRSGLDAMRQIAEKHRNLQAILCTPNDPVAAEPCSDKSTI